MNHTADRGRSDEHRERIAKGMAAYWRSPEGQLERSKRRAKAREARIAVNLARLRGE